MESITESFDQFIARENANPHRPVTADVRLPDRVLAFATPEYKAELLEHVRFWVDCQEKSKEYTLDQAKVIRRQQREAFQRDPINSPQPEDIDKIHLRLANTRSAIRKLPAREKGLAYTKLALEGTSHALTATEKWIREIIENEGEIEEQLGLPTDSPLSYPVRCLLAFRTELKNQIRHLHQSREAITRAFAHGGDFPVLYVSKLLMRLAGVTPPEESDAEKAPAQPEPVFEALKPRTAKPAKSRPVEVLPMH